MLTYETAFYMVQPNKLCDVLMTDSYADIENNIFKDCLMLINKILHSRSRI